MCEIAAANATEAAPLSNFLSSGVVLRATPESASGLCRPGGRETFVNCKVKNCPRPVHRRGWCNAHYQRWWVHGDPLSGSSFRSGRKEGLKYLQAHMHDDGCPIWPFGRNTDGYGIIHQDGRQLIVSRLVCEIVHGPPPTPKHQAAHDCGNGDLGCFGARCVSWKTQKQNSADAVRHRIYGRKPLK